MLLESKEPQEQQAGQFLTSLEYENLMAALNLALLVQVSFLKIYLTLATYLNTTQDQRRGLELGQKVLKHLEFYTPEKLVGSLAIELGTVIDSIATRQLLLKQYKEAKVLFEKSLELLDQFKGIDEKLREQLRAVTYCQLGRVAQEQRQWQQAEQYYQQALHIYNEYNDRYSQASIYLQLGRLAQEEQQWQQANEFLLQALQIFVEYKDNHSANLTLRNLALLWRASDDVNIRASTAKALGKSIEETEKFLLEASEEWEKEQTGGSEKKE